MPITEDNLLRAIHSTSDDVFRKSISFCGNIKEYLEPFPQHKNGLFHRILNLKNFGKFVDWFGNLKMLMDLYPEHREELFQKAMEPEVFKQLIKWPQHLEEIVTMFPNHREELFQKAIEPEAFSKRFAEWAVQLKGLVELFPEHKEDLFKKYFFDSAVLQRISPNFINLRAMIEMFQEHAEELIQEALKDPVSFDRAIVDNAGLIAIKPFCPNIAALQNANNFQEARDAVKNEMMQKNAVAAFAKLSALNRGGFFRGNEPSNNGSNPTERRTSALPHELRKQIVIDHF